MQAIRIDRTQPLRAQPEVGHNRWHPDIPPVLRVQAGEEVVLETLDAFDGQMHRSASTEDVGRLDLNVVHPLTGPVHVEGAEPGDLLEVEFVSIEPQPYGFTVQVPGFGFLRDDFPEPFVAHWEIADGMAASEQLPGVRVPGAPFMGTAGLAPSPELLATARDREQELAGRGGLALPPDPSGAVPTDPAIAETALRTVPPREVAGNVDIKQLTAGARMLIPVYQSGALFSAGDAHFAQGDGEACGTAIEIGSTCTVRFALRTGVAAERGLRDTAYELDDYFMPPELAVPRRCYATTGLSVDASGRQHGEDTTLAARNALLNMIQHLGAQYGYTRQQAYAICSVAVDLRINQMVDVPNITVSALLPLDIIGE